MAESIWRQGFTKVKFKTEDTYLSLEKGELGKILSDWQSGKAFGSYKGIYGHNCHVKLADVSIVIEATAESIAAQEVDDDIDKRLEKAKELTDGG